MTDIKDSFEDRLQDAAVRLAFEQDWLHQEFVTQLEAHMDKIGLSRTKLAQIMGKCPAFVSRAMRSGQNLTIHTMVHMAQAAGLRICLMLAPVAQLTMPKSMSWLPWTIVCNRVLSLCLCWYVAVAVRAERNL